MFLLPLCVEAVKKKSTPFAPAPDKGKEKDKREEKKASFYSPLFFSLQEMFQVFIKGRQRGERERRVKK